MKTLTFRLTLWYAGVVTATVALILLAGQVYLQSHLMRGVDFLNDAEFEEIVHRLEMESEELDDQAAIANAIRLHTEIDASVFYFQVGLENGEVLFRSSNLAGHTLPRQMHGNEKISIRDEELGHLRVGEYTYAGLDIHIGSSLQSVDALFAGSIQTLAWILMFVFLVSLAVGIFLSRIALNPINNIQTIARRISARNLSERIPVPSGKDELSELSTFLNEMFDRLEGAFEQVSRFTADASHELRTPLSLIRLHSERLLHNPDLSVDERMSALSEQMAEIERLNKLIDNLLFIAKADAGVLQLSSKPASIKKYLDDFSEDARILCEDHGIVFESISSEEDELLTIDPSWMRHVLLNLLSNAIRFAPEGSTIRLHSHALSDEYWVLILEDEGEGLSEENVERIFDRFQRNPGQIQRGNQEGTGLGLAICRSIINKHDGRIYARARSDRSGLQLLVELPRQQVRAS